MQKFKSILCALLALALTAAVLLRAVSFFGYDARDAVRERETESLAREAEYQALAARNAIEGLFGVLSAVSGTLSEADGAEIARLRDTVLRTRFSALYVADGTGRALSDRGESVSVAGYDFFRRAMNGESALCKVADSALFEGSGFAFAVPALLGSGITGVVFGILTEADFAAELAVPSKNYLQYALLCDQAGNILCRTQSLYAPTEAANVFAFYEAESSLSASDVDRIREAVKAGASGSAEYRWGDSERRAVYAPLSAEGYYIFIVSPADTGDEIAADLLRRAARLCEIAAACGLLPGLLLGLFAFLRKRGAEAERDRLARMDRILRETSKKGGRGLFEADLVTGDMRYYDADFAANFENGSPIRRVRDLLDAHPHVFEADLPAYFELSRKIREGAARYSTEYRMIDRDGNIAWHRVTVATVRGRRGEGRVVLGRIENVDEEQRELLALRRQAQSDPETGLPNRETFAEQAASHLSTAPVATHALLYIQLPGLPTDRETAPKLCQFADALSERIRLSDLLGRFSDDRIALLIEDLPSREFLDRLMAEILILAETHLSVRARIGAALTPHDGTELQALTGRAEAALSHTSAELPARCFDARTMGDM